MRVANILSTSNASYILENMILPQMEDGIHPAIVVGMFFFVDNKYRLTGGNPAVSIRS